ncbi:MAG: DUF4406 domain-containing protein [Clostridia bacterium]|jgi:hypothetical protein|nr:DUF4406 domain-containing protein [Clostridia bacterium]
MNDRIKAVFICSPFKANSEERRAEYRRYAQEMALSALQEGAAPYAPHLYLPDILDDEDALARRKGILAGIEFLTRCDALWLCTRYGISNGMRKEISAAQRNGIRIIEKK